MKQNIPRTPFSTRLSGSAKETELRIRNIFQWKKKRPPVVLLLLILVLLLGICGGLAAFSSTPRNGPMNQVYPEYFAENSTNYVRYEDKNDYPYVQLGQSDENFTAAIEYLGGTELRAVLGHKRYIGDFNYRNGAFFMVTESEEPLKIELYPDGYIVISTGWGQTEGHKDARVYRAENFDKEEFLQYWELYTPEEEEPTPETPVPETPTPSDSNDPSAVLAAMASIRAESFTNPDPNFLGRCVTTEQLAAALNAAIANQISEEEFLSHGCDSTQIFPHWYIEYAFLEGDPNDFNSKDRHLSVRCGLPENIVEVSLVEDNHRDTAYFEDTALYWLIRSKDAFEDRMTSRDSVAYEQFKPLLIDQMERTLASVSDNPGNFNDYELKRFTIAWTYDNEQDGSHVKLYNFSFGLLTDTPETIGWAGGMALDSHLRVVNVGEPKYFAVKYRNGHVVSTAFLASDYELGRSDQDKERINNALNSAEQTTPSISVNKLDVLDAYRAVLQGQAEYYDPESAKFFNLDQVQAHGYTGSGPRMDLSNFTVVDLDRDGVAEVVVVANWGTAMASNSIILHYQDGAVYGYTRYIRSFNYLTLKADGTFSWAGSAFYHGYATLSFGPDELVANRFTYIDANVDPIMYVVDNALATEEDFNAALTKEETKPDATWYKLNEDDVGRFFE